MAFPNTLQASSAHTIQSIRLLEWWEAMPKGIAFDPPGIMTSMIGMIEQIEQFILGGITEESSAPADEYDVEISHVELIRGRPTVVYNVYNPPLNIECLLSETDGYLRVPIFGTVDI